MTVQWLGVKETSISKHQLCPVTTGIPQCEGDQSVQVQLSITSYVGERETTQLISVHKPRPWAFEENISLIQTR